MRQRPMPVLAETDGDFASGWARLMRWTESHFPALRAALNPPASTAEIDHAERTCGVTFPDDLRALYRAADGETGSNGMFYGLTFLSLAKLVEEWAVWGSVVRESPELIGNEDGFFSSTPAGAIAEVYANPGWIAIAHDHGGNHLGIDLAPGPHGKLGQVINFGADEDAKFVIAPSLAGFLNWYADSLEAGNFVLEESGDHAGALEFAIAEPANAHFLDAVMDMGNAMRLAADGDQESE